MEKIGFSAVDLRTGKEVKIDSIEFYNGELAYINVILENEIRECRQDGEDLKLFLNGKEIK